MHAITPLYPHIVRQSPSPFAKDFSEFYVVLCVEQNSVQKSHLARTSIECPVQRVCLCCHSSFTMSLPPSPLKPNLGESSTLPKPTPHTGMKKLRKKKRTNNMNRALDEHDDVDESDLVAGPAKRRRIGVDDDDESEDDEEEDGEDGDGVEGVQESERLLGQDGSDKLEKRNTRRRKQA
jgi:hypothetical protein